MKRLLILLLISLFNCAQVLAGELSPELDKLIRNNETKKLVAESPDLQKLFHYYFIEKKLYNYFSFTVDKVDPSISSEREAKGFTKFYSKRRRNLRSQTSKNILINKQNQLIYTPIVASNQQDIDFLLQFPNLQYVQVKSTKATFRNIDFSQFKNLRELYVAINNLEKVTFGKGNGNMEVLSLAGEGKSFENSLQYLKNLKYFSVSSADITDYSQLQAAKNLEYIYIGTRLPRLQIPNFSNFENLKYLQLWTTYTQEIKGLEKCNKLKFLDLSKVNISKTVLPPNIETLKLFGSDEDDDLENIAHLNKLKSLHLGNFKVNDFKIIGNLKSLEKVITQYTPFENADGIENLTKLQEAWFQGTSWSVMPNFSSAVNLKELVITGSKIDSLSNLEHLPALEKLSLEYNQIEEVSNLNRLKHIKKLKRLSLKRNPLKDFPVDEFKVMKDAGFPTIVEIYKTPFAEKYKNEESDRMDEYRESYMFHDQDW